MADAITTVDLLSDGSMLLLLDDGREALIRQTDVIRFAETTDGFEQAKKLYRQAEEQDRLLKGSRF